MDATLPWESPAAPPGLGEGETHVWRVAVDRPRWDPRLVAEERHRLLRFRFPEDSAREATGRGALRFLLGGYLGVPSDEVGLAAGAHGKPMLAAGPGAGIEFNLSHSGGWVLLAFARGGRVGVDLEQEREVDEERIARGFFHAEEVAEWARQPESDRRAAFFRLWTLKEAYLKALGTGLSKAPGSFRIAGCARSGASAVAWCVDDPRAPERWRVERLEMPAGYAAAVAMERPLGRLRRLVLGSD